MLYSRKDLDKLFNYNPFQKEEIFNGNSFIMFNNIIKDIYNIEFSNKIHTILFDLDLIMVYNCKYGHFEGDKILEDIKNYLKNNNNILSFHIGGDEFFILTNMNKDLFLADIKNILNKYKMKSTFSILTFYNEETNKKPIITDITFKTVLQTLDMLLYFGKSNCQRNSIIELNSLIFNQGK